MSAKSTNLKVGMFAIAAVAIFVAGLMTLGARDRFKARTTFETAVAGHVTGLSVGSAVKFRGVPMGKVTDIRLAWSKYPETKHDYVVVEFQVDNEFLSREQRRDPRGTFAQWAGTGLRAKLEGQGITGLSILTLDVLDPQRSPAPPIDWEPEHIYIPSAPSLFGAMLDSISVSLEKIRNLDVDGLVVDVRALLVSLDAVAVKLSKVDIESIGSEARDRLVELKTTNERLALLLQQARTALVGLS